MDVDSRILKMSRIVCRDVLHGFLGARRLWKILASM